MILGLMGEAGAGKDYVADYLTNKYDNIYKMAFADKLKNMASDLFNFDIADAYTHEGKKKIVPGVGKTIRTILQEFGDKMRQIYAPIWIEHVLRVAQGLMVDGGHVIIPDVRYRNELEAIHSAGGKVIRVVRLGYKELNGQEAQHPSESEQRKIKNSALDGVITAQSGDLEGLENAISLMWHKIVNQN